MLGRTHLNFSLLNKPKNYSTKGLYQSNSRVNFFAYRKYPLLSTNFVNTYSITPSSTQYYSTKRVKRPTATPPLSTPKRPQKPAKPSNKKHSGNNNKDEADLDRYLQDLLRELPPNEQETVINILETAGNTFTDEQLFTLVRLGVLKMTDEDILEYQKNRDTIEKEIEKDEIPRYSEKDKQAGGPGNYIDVDYETQPIKMKKHHRGIIEESTDDDGFDEIEELRKRDREIDEKLSKGKSTKEIAKKGKKQSKFQPEDEEEYLEMIDLQERLPADKKKSREKSTADWMSSFDDLKKLGDFEIEEISIEDFEELTKNNKKEKKGKKIKFEEIEEDDLDDESIETLLNLSEMKIDDISKEVDNFVEEKNTKFELSEKKKLLEQRFDEMDQPMEKEKFDRANKENQKSTNEILQSRMEREMRLSKLQKYHIGDVILPQYLRDKIISLMNDLNSQYQSGNLSPVTLPSSTSLVDEKLLETPKANKTGEQTKNNQSTSSSSTSSSTTPTRKQIPYIKKSTQIEILKQRLHQIYRGSPEEAYDIISGSKFSERPQINYNLPESVIYSYYYMPGAFASLVRIFSEVSRILPEFVPERILDFGAGPGTGSFAAAEEWGLDSLHHVMAVEPSSHMMEVHQSLLKNNKKNLVTFRRYLPQGKETADYHLVISSSTLSSIYDRRERKTILRSLWKYVAPGGLLVISENGSPVGFEIVKEARAILISEVLYPGKIISPCPHMHSCPIASGGWCHFKQRVQTFAKHERNILDAPYSYVVFQKPGELPQKSETENDEDDFLEGKKDEQSGIDVEESEEDFDIEEGVEQPVKQKKMPKLQIEKKIQNTGESFGKIITKPLKKTGHVILDVCSPDGTLAKITISQSMGKDFYTSARKSKCGDNIVIPVSKDEIKVKVRKEKLDKKEEEEKRKAAAEAAKKNKQKKKFKSKEIPIVNTYGKSNQRVLRKNKDVTELKTAPDTLAGQPLPEVLPIKKKREKTSKKGRQTRADPKNKKLPDINKLK